MLPPNKLLEKIDEYLKKIDSLNEEIIFAYNKHEHPDKVIRLDTSLKRFIRSSFPDGDIKLQEYKDDYRAGPWVDGDTEYSEREDRKKLKVMENHLLAFKEEVEDQKKLYEIMYKTRETELEAGRRESVVKEKEAGATIELLTLMREELKSRKKQEKEISELRKEIEDLKKNETKNGGFVLRVSADEKKQMREQMAKDITESKDKLKVKKTRQKPISFKRFFHKDTRILRPFEYEQILKGAESGHNGFDNKINLKTLLFTGLRYSEAVRFQNKPEWYKPGKNIILLPRLEGDKRGTQLGRKVRLPPNSYETIEGFFKASLLPKTSGGWAKNLKRWGKKEGLNPAKINVKTTRYTWTSWLIRSFPDEGREVINSQGMTQWSRDYSNVFEYYFNLPFTEQDEIDIKKYVEGW